MRHGALPWAENASLQVHQKGFGPLDPTFGTQTSKNTADPNMTPYSAECFHTSLAPSIKKVIKKSDLVLQHTDTNDVTASLSTQQAHRQPV